MSNRAYTSFYRGSQSATQASRLLREPNLPFPRLSKKIPYRRVFHQDYSYENELFERANKQLFSLIFCETTPYTPKIDVISMLDWQFIMGNYSVSRWGDELKSRITTGIEKLVKEAESSYDCSHTFTDPQKNKALGLLFKGRREEGITFLLEQNEEYNRLRNQLISIEKGDRKKIFSIFMQNGYDSTFALYDPSTEISALDTLIGARNLVEAALKGTSHYFPRTDKTNLINFAILSGYFILSNKAERYSQHNQHEMAAIYLKEAKRWLNALSDQHGKLLFISKVGKEGAYAPLLSTTTCELNSFPTTYERFARKMSK